MIRILEYGKLPNSEIFARVSPQADVAEAVAQIIQPVRAEGDKALLDYTLRFDGAGLTRLDVTEREIEEAFQAVEPSFLEILGSAAANIRAFHEKQVRNSFVLTEQNGVILGQKVTPIEKVGVYVPGGRAAYPSTVLMDTIPAKIAGCEEIVMVTPPGKDGKVNPAILAAAKMASAAQKLYFLGSPSALNQNRQ